MRRGYEDRVQNLVEIRSLGGAEVFWRGDNSLG